ncbi:O-antigen ligase family protein [Marinicella rhabdoformis]|uniref:O-antigen ligase family protein n=1 Tax=Marinicella rhabdoformis TaxID=2580566 RepID=UPI0012AEB293|nr:O-antigen ligase family protein [Marinicella rhabdoformis]
MNMPSEIKRKSVDTDWGIKTVCFLLFLVPVLLPFGRLYELPVLLLSVFGLIHAIKGRHELSSNHTVKLFSSVYALYFLLMFVASIDSYWPDKSWLVTWGSLRFYFAGLAVLLFCSESKYKIHSTLLMSITVLMTFWSVDALVQYLLGHDLFGIQSYPGRLSGVFGMNVKLGPVLALFLPFALMYLKQKSPWLRWLVVAVLLLVIVLSGTRSAWLMAAFVMLAFWWTQVKGRRLVLMVKSMLFLMVATLLLWKVSPDFKQRLERSAAVFQGDSAGLDFALADRLPIWQTAWEMIKAHPLNGVGPRAFRKAYPDYAASNDVWLAQNTQGLHAHHWLLEVMAETGVFGLLLFSAMAFILIQIMIKHKSNQCLWAPAVALVAAFLPVVSLYSIFSSFWSMCLWWVLVLFFVAVKDD